LPVYWTRLSDQIRYDWTWEHCQDRQAAGQDCNDFSDSVPSGVLTLPEGLTRSCNPFFYEIGYTLYQQNRANDIANMARAFGLGAPTGIEIPEQPGRIVDPTSAIDMINQSIGQGEVQVTPLQVARFIAALGNGGTLFRPQLVERIEPVDGSAASLVFKPEAQGTLPVQTFRLEVIQQAMINVVSNPRGTANFRMRGISIPVAGKTGRPSLARASRMPGSRGIPWPRTQICLILPSLSSSKTREKAQIGLRRSSSAWSSPIFMARRVHCTGSNPTSA
jgi:cell division protein FtsI/penicillin-binding protein 2